MVAVLTQGYLARPIRRIYPRLLCCPQCAGVWIGAASLVALRLWATLPGWARLSLEVVYAGFAISLIATVIDVVMTVIGSWARASTDPPDPKDPCAKIRARGATENAGSKASG